MSSPASSSKIVNNLPELVPFDDPNFKEIHYGPTDASNWLIPNRVLMSGYPGDLDSEKAKLKIANLLKAGINCFICLQLKEELVRFKPYKPLVEEYCAKEENGISVEGIEFLNLPIPDNFVTKDEILMDFVNTQIIPKLQNEQTKCLLH